MAKYTWDRAESVPQNENNSESRTDNFLKLKNDKETALARFLANSIDDIELHSTHRVHVKSSQGKEWDTAVECLRTDGSQPVTACPFCEKGIGIKNEIYMQVFDESTKTAKVFTRPKSFVEQIRSMLGVIERFGNGAPIASALVRITRNGAKGSKDTTYSLEVIEFTQGVTLETLKRDYGVEIRDVHDLGCLRDVTWNEANEWARTGNLPAPAKQKVDGYGRPFQEQRPQEAVHQPQRAQYQPPVGQPPVGQYQPPVGQPPVGQPAPQAVPPAQYQQPVGQPAQYQPPVSQPAQPQQSVPTQVTYNGQPAQVDSNGEVSVPSEGAGNGRRRRSRFN